MLFNFKFWRESIRVKAGKYKIILVASLILFACNQQIRKESNTAPHTVEIREQNGKFQLYRNGSPYFIKGAAGYEHLDLVKATGGNSIRTWNTENAQEILDNAYKNGLTVTLGLPVAYAGIMEYSEEAKVAAQLEQLKKEVIRYKDHPALLMWGIGNELNARVAGEVLENVRLWEAINDIAKMIHEVDPNHPTTTMLPDIPKLTTRYISYFCPDIDILSFNVFDDISTIPDRVSNAGWNGPYLISEYGIQAYWNTPRTEWYAQVEPTSREKAQLIQDQYRDLKEANKGRWLGAYAFFWGFKREYTSTWFSLFTECDERTEMLDALQYIWSGKWPIDRAPSITDVLINNTKSEQNIYVQGKGKLVTTVNVQHTTPENLTLIWEVQKDFVEMYFDATVGQDKAPIVSSGSMPLKLCKKITTATTNNSLSGDPYQFEITAPAYEGPYRLMVSVVDKQNKAATGNAVFYVYH